MVSNTLILLLESRICNCRLGQYRLVEALNVHWDLALNAHHSKPVSQAAKILATLLHSKKLRTEATTFDADLFIR